MFLLYKELQLFCIYNTCHRQCYFARDIRLVLLHRHFPQLVCSPQYGWFCISLVSCSPGLLLLYRPSDLSMIPVNSIITDYFCFHILHELNFHYEVLVFWNLLSFLLGTFVSFFSSSFFFFLLLL
jgi:hypothetical protein